MAVGESGKHRRIFFALEQDEDGYPPVGEESVWGREEGEGLFVIENIPFFAREATIGDVVKAEEDDGVLRYKATVRHSGNSLIRVLYYEGTDPKEAQEELERLGCETELLPDFRLIAVNVPPDVSLLAVQALLQRNSKEGKWGYEEPLLDQ